MSNQFTKNLEQSFILNNFSTNCEFTKSLGIEVLKGSATTEHLETLTKSIKGVEDFLNLLKEKLSERKDG